MPELCGPNMREYTRPAAASGSGAKTKMPMRGRSPMASSIARPAVRARGREEEDGLGEIHLARDLLHEGVVEPARVEEHGERIAAEHAVREHIHLDELVGARRHGSVLQLVRLGGKASYRG